MSRYSSEEIASYYAQTYDESVSDWPGEIDFYLRYAAVAASDELPVLELACGTGRVAIRLAKQGYQVTGLDISSPMLDVARSKSINNPNITGVEGDMRSFDLGRTFGLIIIPGHSFQNILTPSGQVSCIDSIRMSHGLAT
jgi:ubiquinone/menaquinone biosynthesis C-methylase UbiE